MLWIRERIFKYSTPTPVMDKIAQTDFLLFWFMSLSWNICRHFLLSLSVFSYQSSACFLVSWCPLMFRWENSPRAGRHPCQSVVGTGTRAEKSQYQAFEEWAPVAMVERCHGAVSTRGAQLLPSFLLRNCCCGDYYLSPKSQGEAALASCYVNRAPCACRKPSAGWYGNPHRSTRRCSVGDRFIGETTVVAVET